VPAVKVAASSWRSITAAGLATPPLKEKEKMANKEEVLE